MIEKQRLDMERDLAVARRALERAKHTAERGAYYELEEALSGLSMAAAEVMKCLMARRDDSPALANVRAYLYSSVSYDRSSTSGQSMRSRAPGLQAGR